MNQHNELRQRLRQRVNQKQTQLVKTPEQTLQQVQIALALLPLLTACLYLLGMVWYMGYAEFFHIDTSEFPLPADQTLLFGALALVSNLAPYTWYPIWAFVFYLLLFVVIAFTSGYLKIIQYKAQGKMRRVDDHVRQNKVFKFLSKNAMQPHEAKTWETRLDIVFTLFLQYSVLICLCILIAILSIYSYSNGEKDAKAKIEKIKNGSYASVNTLQYSKYPEGVSALRIACNATQCAFWTEKDGTIYLRHEQIDSVTIPPTPDEKAAAPR